MSRRHTATRYGGIGRRRSRGCLVMGNFFSGQLGEPSISLGRHEENSREDILANIYAESNGRYGHELCVYVQGQVVGKCCCWGYESLTH